MSSVKHFGKGLVVALGLAAVVGLAWLAARAPAAAPAGGADWHQHLGPKRDNISPETGWSTDWGEGGPKELWTASVGAGYSAVSVANGRAYTMGNDGKADTVWCFDAAKGTELWKKSYPCGRGDHPGPRCTPTIDGDVVYTLSYYGHLHCFKAASGDIVWAKNLAQELGTGPPTWGFACSPLVDGDRLIVDVGAVAALDKASGKVLWKSEKTQAGYSSPVVFTHGGKKYLPIFSGKFFQVLDAANGRRVASLPWKTSYDVNAATALVQGDRIFISSGYGTGCALLQFTGEDLKVLWRKRVMRNHFNTCVLYKGHVYGIDGNVGNTSVKCLDFAEGEEKWSQPTGPMAGLLLSDGKLVILNDPGDLIVCQADPSGYKELARARVGSSKCWTPPTLSHGRIYCRSHLGQVVCVDVSK